MKKANVWMSVSDLMTGLMIIFLFIAIAYISKVQSNQSVLKDFVDNKKDMHGKMVDKFKSETQNGTVTIGGDLSLRFEKAETLFPMGSDELTPEFKRTLAEIMPKYLDLILNESKKDEIREIRIEGHTDDTPYPKLNSDPYMANLILSQRRARNVMEYIRSLKEYKAYSPEKKRLLDYWFTANGLSYGKALDRDGGYALKTGKPIDAKKSRRVEFRIITTGEEVLEDFVDSLKNYN